MNTVFFQSTVGLTNSIRLYQKVITYWSQVKSLLSRSNECSPYITYSKEKNKFILRYDEALFYQLLIEDDVEEIVIYPTTFEQFFYHGEKLSDEYIQYSIMNVLESYMTSKVWTELEVK